MCGYSVDLQNLISLYLSPNVCVQYEELPELLNLSLRTANKQLKMVLLLYITTQFMSLFPEQSASDTRFQGRNLSTDVRNAPEK